MKTLQKCFVVTFITVLTCSSALEAAPIYSTVVMDDNPNAYWRLGESSGPTAVDQTGNHNGTYSGAVTLGQTGAIVNDSNTAVDFTNSGVVNITNGTGLGGTQALSIELWATADTLADYQTLFMRTSSVAWNDGFGLYYYSPTGQNQLRFFINGYSTTFVGATFTTTSSYRHVVATYLGGQSGSNNVLSIYIDGVLASSFNTTVSSVNFGNGNAYIGAAPGSPTYSWDGKIDEVSIYSSVLSPEDVAAHYAAGVSPVPEPDSMALILTGGLALVLFRKRFSKRAV